MKTTYLSFLILIILINLKIISSYLTPISYLIKSQITKKSFFSSYTARKLQLNGKNNEEYWGGDWVCNDCGYIYDIEKDGKGLKFEEILKGKLFLCPKCFAPKTRFSRKIKNQNGESWTVFLSAFLTIGIAILLSTIYGSMDAFWLDLSNYISKIGPPFTLNLVV